MSDDQSKALSDAETQDIVSNAYAIAASLQKTGNPNRSMRILSIAAGMTLCASAKSREQVDATLALEIEQIKAWCDFEEAEKSASWVDKTS